jgi:hypothetical protein
MLIEITEYIDGYAGDGARGRGRDGDDASRGEASFPIAEFGPGQASERQVVQLGGGFVRRGYRAALMPGLP